MVKMLFNLFNKRKMEIEQLKQENEGLKAQLAGLAFNLKNADAQVAYYQKDLEFLTKRVKDLEAEVKHLNMLGQTSQTNKNDSRYY